MGIMLRMGLVMDPGGRFENSQFGRSFGRLFDRTEVKPL